MRRLTLLLVLTLGLSQTPREFRLQHDRRATNGLLSNIVSEIVLQGDSLVWLGTGKGIARVRDSLTIESLDTLSVGPDRVPMTFGISAITADSSNLFFASATNDGDVSVGGGIYYSTNARDSLPTWTYFPQPVDGAGDSIPPIGAWFFRALPVTTDHQNVTYDASLFGRYLWIASWAGGIRRYDLTSNSWDRIPLPEDGEQKLITCADSAYVLSGGKEILKEFYLNPRDPSGGGNHNHKGFSVLAYGDTIWVGTANGINRGLIGAGGCVDWQHYFYPTNNITGNFVVGLAKQDWNGRRRIWAACLNADDPTEERGLSWTDNDGLTWHRTLVGERIYNVVTQDSIILAASDRGLWKSEDGETWALFRPARDGTPLQSDEILSDEVYAAALDVRLYYPTPVIWIGTGDGLARSRDLDGSAWKIFRTEYNPNQIYAYPNPFSPDVHNIQGDDGYVRIHTDVKTSFVIDMDVYNFAMEHVVRRKYDRTTGDGTLKWNGRDASGRRVANGTYFIRLKYDTKTEWIKLIVLK